MSIEDLKEQMSIKDLKEHQSYLFTMERARQIISMIDAGCIEYREYIPLGFTEEEIRAEIAARSRKDSE